MQRISPYLTLAGVIPFWAAAILLAVGVMTMPLLGDVHMLLSVYALVIAAFMAGAHWGQHLTLSSNWGLLLPIFSNAIALGLWLAFLHLAFNHLMLAYSLAFAILLAIDFGLHQRRLIEKNYFVVRCIVTVAVILALLVAYFSQI